MTNYPWNSCHLQHSNSALVSHNHKYQRFDNQTGTKKCSPSCTMAASSIPKLKLAGLRGTYFLRRLSEGCVGYKQQLRVLTTREEGCDGLQCWHLHTGHLYSCRFTGQQLLVGQPAIVVVFACNYLFCKSQNDCFSLLMRLDLMKDTNCENAKCGRTKY